eukprot:TRINITY_DN7930_c0_g1_i3.p1 TRINITY_DN7930_c0_g1~~TRINITY_DN7930_c0_g1_i3.p1  ORF type:complete len:387 (+),score=21.30 TRINITY_DN7930_c0_g1_i3:168-1163(+)
MQEKPYPLTVRVLCGSAVGIFYVEESKVQLPDGRKISGTEFERLGGKGSCKRWKQTLKVIEQDGEPGRALEHWLADYGLEIRGNLFIYNGEVSVIDGIASSGSGQPVISLSEMKSHLENTFIGYREGYRMTGQVLTELPQLPIDDPAFGQEEIDLRSISPDQLQLLADQSAVDPFRDLLANPPPIPEQRLAKVTGQVSGKQVLNSRQGSLMNSPQVLLLLGQYLRGERAEAPWEHMGVSNPPIIQNRQLNLKVLYLAVQAKGGFAEVGRKRAWSQVCKEMEFDEEVSGLIKDEYQRFLYKYERQEGLQRENFKGVRQQYKSNFRLGRGGIY